MEICKKTKPNMTVKKHFHTYIHTYTYIHLFDTEQVKLHKMAAKG